MECSLGYGGTRDKKRLEETRLLTDVRYLSLSKDTQPKALQLFYESQTCADLHDKSTGLYLYGDLYVADEFMREKWEKGYDELTANGADGICPVLSRDFSRPVQTFPQYPVSVCCCYIPYYCKFTF